MPPPEQDGNSEWSRRYSGPNADVWFHERCTEELKKLDTTARARIEACMNKMYCQVEKPDQISKTKLNRNEGRRGSRKLLVQAFKSGSARVYGVEGSIKGKRTFFAAVGAVKKKPKADPDILKKAADRVVSAIDNIPGASV